MRIQIHPLLISDVAAVNGIKPADWGDLRPIFDYYVQAKHCHPIKLEVDGVLAGVGATIVHKHSVWLAHILVHEKHHNHGYGGRITQDLIDGVDRDEFPSIQLIATELGAPIYRRLGFRHVTQYAVFQWEEGRFSDFKVSSAAYDEKWKSEILAMDHFVSGEGRLDTLSEHLSSARLIVEEGKLEGVYFPTLREGLIIARTDAAGTALLNLHVMHATRAIMPKENASAMTFMRQLGLKPVKYVERMEYGETLSWHPECLYNRIGGNLG